MTRIDTGLVRRVLVIKLRHIGDVLLCVPTVSALKSAVPGVSVTALVPEGTEDMLTLNPDIDEVITLRRGAGIIENLRLVMRLRAGRFDLAINMTEGDRGAILSFLSGARFRIGVNPWHRGFWGKRRLYTHVVTQVYDGRHRAELDLALLAPLGIKPAEPRLAIYTSPEDDAYVEGLLREAGIAPGTEYAVVHPTSRWLFKCWRDEAVAGVIDHLEARGIRAVVTSGPDAREMEKVAHISGLCKARPVDLSGRLNLKRLASLLKRCTLFFGVDTAPMHMAAAAGVPVVALFGPSDSSVWGPYTDRRVIVDRRSEFGCMPCRKDGCDGSKRSKCLEAITVEEAVAAIEELIGASDAG